MMTISEAVGDYAAAPVERAGHRMHRCRCGRMDVVRDPPATHPVAIDLVHDRAGVPLTGFPVGWRLYAWRNPAGDVVHTEARCPDCPAPRTKGGEPDARAEEVDRA